MFRRTSILLALTLALAAVAAGCVKKDDPGDGGAPPGNGTATTTPPTGTTPPPGGNGTGGGPTMPAPSVVTDKGTIQGPFDKSWPIPVSQVSPRAVNVMFNLTGVQAGAPPTARLVLQFLDPAGAVLKSATVGLGGSGNALAWSFGPAEVAAAGEYKLRATADATVPGPGLPSGGAANYELLAVVEY